MFAIGSSVWPGISKLIKKCGEIGQVAGKLIATGGNVAHWDGSNLRERLQDELADVIAACRFVISRNGLDVAAIEKRVDAKLALFNKWHFDQQQTTARATMKWNIKSAITGTDFGTHEADNEDGAMEALAQELATNEGVDIEHVRSELSLGRYNVTRVSA